MYHIGKNNGYAIKFVFDSIQNGVRNGNKVQFQCKNCMTEFLIKCKILCVKLEKRDIQRKLTLIIQPHKFQTIGDKEKKVNVNKGDGHFYC